MDPVIPLPSNRLEKMERIKKGPYQPMNIQFPRKTVGTSKRSFHSKWYHDYNWLEYSQTLDAAFCFPCRCFALQLTTKRGHSDLAFIKKGFTNWNIGPQKCCAHQTSET